MRRTPAKGVHRRYRPETTPVPGTDFTLFDIGIFQGSFTSGASAAFLVGAFMMVAASAVIWIFLNVKHTELATDAAEGPVHVG